MGGLRDTAGVGQDWLWTWELVMVFGLGLDFTCNGRYGW
jgi:hypothetical protein